MILTTQEGNQGQLSGRGLQPATTLPSRRTAPDAPSTYQPFFVDHAVTLARGNFPQLSRIGWHPTRDAVVMLPRNPVCDTVANAAQAQLKYYPSGFPAFTLSVGDSHCAVIGVADPL